MAWDGIQTQLWWWGCKGQRSPRELSVVKSAFWYYCTCKASFSGSHRESYLFEKSQYKWKISLFICKLFRFRGLHPLFFLCYLLQNNYRNHGDFCWVYEWKVRTMWILHWVQVQTRFVFCINYIYMKTCNCIPCEHSSPVWQPKLLRNVL